MTKDEALKMCLEYIETNAQGSKFAILIKEALAQPEQEPVAIVHVRPLMGNESIPQTRIEWKNGRPVAGPLYTTPPQRTWVGLTDVDIQQMGLKNYIKVVRETEAKLKELNL